jgi:intein/homing endonuclease
VNATAEHPFYVGNDEFRQASELKEGDTVYLLSGAQLSAQKIISVERVDSPTDVYNLQVGVPNTFFANNFAVHNKPICH